MLNTFILLYLLIQAKSITSPFRQLQESSDEIIILHLNDVHCGVNDTIGYDGFVLYRDELMKKNPNIISVDVGDHVQGGTLGSISEGGAIIDIMNKVGFDVAILGNHEFDYGVERLKQLENNITSKYISSNFCYKKDKKPIFNPYKIIEKNGKKIAFIGVLTPLTFSKTFLSTLRDSNGNAIYDFLTDNNNQELYDTVQSYINEAREKKGADYVILLTHIGMDVEQYTSNGLLSNLVNVDAVLDGHTHVIYNTTSKDKNKKDIHISQTGTKLQSIGKLIIKNGTISSEIIQDIPEPSNTTNAIKITRGKKDIWVNKDMNNFLNNIWAEYEDELNIQYGHSDYDLIIRPEGTTDSHYIYCRHQECSVGNLLTDAIKWSGNAEVTIINGGGIRSNINKGNITRSQLIAASPFFNNIIVKRLPGQCILDALEHGVANLPNATASFPQVSGLSYDVDISFKSNVVTDSQGLFLNVTGKRRVSNVKVNGEDLDLNKIYNVSMNEYIGAGGDGYTMLAKYEVFNESLITDTDSLASYIKYELNGKIPIKYKDSQGRISIVNAFDSTIIPTSTTSLITNPDSKVSENTSGFLRYNYRKKVSGGLSTGAIVAAIFCVCVF